MGLRRLRIRSPGLNLVAQHAAVLASVERELWLTVFDGETTTKGAGKHRSEHLQHASAVGCADERWEFAVNRKDGHDHRQRFDQRDGRREQRDFFTAAHQCCEWHQTIAQVGLTDPQICKDARVQQQLENLPTRVVPHLKRVTQAAAVSIQVGGFARSAALNRARRMRAKERVLYVLPHRLGIERGRQPWQFALKYWTVERITSVPFDGEDGVCFRQGGLDFALLLAELLEVQVGVESARRDQRCVCADLLNRAVLEHDDLVGVSHEVQVVRNDDRGLVPHEGAQRKQHQMDGIGIQPCRGLVKDQDGRIANERAGNGESLALATREIGAALPEACVIAVGQLFDELPRVRLNRRGEEFLARRVAATVGDILCHGAAEQDGLLKHHADLRAQRIESERANIVPVDHYLARAGIVQARQKLRDGALACASMTHQREHFAGRDIETHILERQSG